MVLLSHDVGGLFLSFLPVHEKLLLLLLVPLEL